MEEFEAWLAKKRKLKRYYYRRLYYGEAEGAEQHGEHEGSQQERGEEPESGGG